MNLDSIEFILEIIFLKNKGWSICNKPWWICRCWRTLDCFACKKKLKLFILIVLELNMFLKKLKRFIGQKNIKTNIFRIQANNSICGYFCIGFIDFMLAGKTLIEYTSLLSLYDIKNDNIILCYSKNEWSN